MHYTFFVFFGNGKKFHFVINKKGEWHFDVVGLVGYEKINKIKVKTWIAEVLLGQKKFLSQTLLQKTWDDFRLRFLSLLRWIRCKTFPKSKCFVCTCWHNGRTIRGCAQMKNPRCVTCQLCYFGHGRVLPNCQLVVSVAMSWDYLLIVNRPL